MATYVYIGMAVIALASAAYSYYVASNAKIPDAGVPQTSEMQISGPEEGTPIYDFLGSTKITGGILWYGGSRTVEVKEEQKGGKGGGGGGGEKKQTTTGYKYYLSVAMAICQGPIDELYTIFKDDKTAWSGNAGVNVSALNYLTLALDLGDGETGSCTVYTGRNNPALPTNMQNLMVASGISADKLPHLKGIAWVYFDDIYIGTYNRAPSFRFVLGKYPKIAALGALERINYDYNPVYAIYYILTTMAGLPATYFHTASFQTAAAAIYAESLGVSVLFDTINKAMTYIEGMSSHIDSVLRFSSDGLFHYELYRKLADTSTLPVVDETMMIEDLQLSRKSWIDTVSEVKCQFAERVWRTETTDAITAEEAAAIPDPSTSRIGYTTQQMSVGETQTFSVVDCLPEVEYHWEVTSGGGSCSPETGCSTVYTAPATNPSCANNPVISLLDANGNVIDTVTVAVNAYLDQYAAYVTKEAGTCTPWYNWNVWCYNCDSITNSYNCAGGQPAVLPVGLNPTYTDQHGTATTCAPDDCDECYYNSGPGFVVGTTETRTAEMIAAGCCPAALL